VRVTLAGLHLCLLSFLWAPLLQAQEPVRVGVLYSQTGTMAISEVALRADGKFDVIWQSELASPAIPGLIRSRLEAIRGNRQCLVG
jgi:hypothetical protein